MSVMILGVGVDIVEISRFDQTKVNEAFIKKVFTPKEIKECRLRGNRAELFTQKFALKEAFMKAIGAGIGQEVWFTNIEVLGNLKQAQITPKKKAKNYYEALGANCIRASYSGSGGVVVGFVVVADLAFDTEC
jgi:holo-[acyl-carrier protein] synthase